MTQRPPLDGKISKRLLTAAEAAEYLGIAEWTVRQWASMGRIPKVKLRGKSLRFDKADLDQIIATDKIPPRKSG